MALYRFSGKTCDYIGDTASKDAKALLGGKGAGLVMMAQQGLNVPPGFTITTDACNEYRAICTAYGTNAKAYADAKKAFIDDLMPTVMVAMEWLQDQFGYMPLVSVRSGAPVSMPGMMDTILNVGLTDDNSYEWDERIGSRAVADSRRRLIQMLGSTGYGVPMEVFDFQFVSVKKDAEAHIDTDLVDHHLQTVGDRYLAAFKQNKGFEFPINDAKEQLRVAIKAVFDSWMNPRAIKYRKINKISEDMGTAVNVQAMVFGNMNNASGSGVLFTRNPSTGERKIFTEYLVNAQGEDVVAGIRTPETLDLDNPPISSPPDWRETLAKVSKGLEAAYSDMVDLEFTVQSNELFILQSRTGKRSARAAFKIATDLVKEGVIDIDTALKRLTVEQFKVVRRPSIDPKFKTKPNLTGLPACPGVVSGKPVFTAEEAVKCKEPCILVRHETDPDDIAGMAKAVGILTQTGGATSHAAVVARAMDKPCVVGCTALDIEAMKAGYVKVITIDGSTGNVWIGLKAPVIDSSDDPAIRQVMGWCLDKLGAVEAAAVGDQSKVCRVFASHWWGNLQVAQAVLPEVNMLDVRSPVDFMQKEDAGLLECFGQTDIPTFGVELVKLAHSLAVPVLTGAEESVKPALPADYATFKVLGAA